MSFLLTRRTALISGLSSLLVPATSVLIEKAVEIADPWDDVAHHAFALQDAFRALPEQYWYVFEAGLGGRDPDRMHVFNKANKALRVLDRPAHLR